MLSPSKDCECYWPNKTVLPILLAQPGGHLPLHTGTAGCSPAKLAPLCSHSCCLSNWHPKKPWAIQTHIPMVFNFYERLRPWCKPVLAKSLQNQQSAGWLIIWLLKSLGSKQALSTFPWNLEILDKTAIKSHFNPPQPLNQLIKFFSLGLTTPPL